MKMSQMMRKRMIMMISAGDDKEDNDDDYRGYFVAISASGKEDRGY